MVFIDVPADHWACDSIESAFAKGIINGIGDQKFGTGQTLTRAQTAQIMFNAYGGSGLTDETVKIEDAPDGAWYTEAVTWLLQYDLAELREGKFYPDEPAPRWFIADVLYKLAVSLDTELPKENEAVAFPDMVGDYAPYSEAVTALQQAGIISGFPDGTYGPEQTLTRCQMTKLIDLFTEIPGLMPGTKLTPPKPDAALEPAPSPDPTPAPAPTPEPTPEPTPDPTPTPTPEPTPEPTSPSGSNVWWSDSIYQEILDYAATKDGVVTHMDETSGNVIIYVAAKWPVMRHYRLTFSNEGFSYTLFRWVPKDNLFYDFGTEKTSDPAIPLWLVDCTDGDYHYYKDREPWASTSPNAKFPWE
jgi:hypothetical protein